MTKTRRILVVMAMTSALCADQMAPAAPAFTQSRFVEFAEMAHRMVARLGQSFRDTVPAVLHQPVRQARPAVRQTARIPAAPVLPARQYLASPFQFRLPPPAI